MTVSLLTRAATMTAIWFLLTGDIVHSWPYGLVIVPVTLSLSFVLLPRRTAGSPFYPGLLALLPVLAWKSVQAGTDVALRAVLPARRMDPGLIEYRTRMPEPIPVLLGLFVSMLPGTLAVAQHGTTLVIHTLNRRGPVEQEIARFEALLDRLLRPEFIRG